MNREDIIKKLLSYVCKEIHCIKDYDNAIKKGGFYTISYLAEQGKKKCFEFTKYKSYIKVIQIKINDKDDNNPVHTSFLIDFGNMDDIYDEDNFFEHFELRTLSEIRQDKIKNILE